MSHIAVVVPTIRPESYAVFEKAWSELFAHHRVVLIRIQDGATPRLDTRWYGEPKHVDSWDNLDFMGDDADLIHNFSPACRNLGFAYIAKYMPQVNRIITLDDDTEPFLDTIADHLKVLDTNTSISWVNTLLEDGRYPRGFPYWVRHQADVMLSHGVWHGVADWDAPTQLVLGNPPTDFYRGPVPKGIEVPICGMNLAFKRDLLPYVYYAPVSQTPGCQRFDDIWMGRHLKRKLDEMGKAMVTGYAAVRHERASDPFKNLEQEAVGIRWNEDYWERQDEPFFKMYAEKRQRWETLIKGWMS